MALGVVSSAGAFILGLVCSPALTTLALATLASEDLTCISAGLLVERGELGFAGAVGGCAAGILLGDLALFALGRSFGRAVLNWRPVRSRVSEARVEGLARWFDQNTGKAVLLSRFTPGLRLPGYLAAGILGRRPAAFVAWTVLAVMLWTPLLVGAVAVLGDRLAAPLRHKLGNGWTPALLMGAIAWLILQSAQKLSTPIGRAWLWSKLARLWRWEFWPGWLFYLPITPYLAWLALRSGGLRTITAVNPGIPHSGFVGESKHDILQRLNSDRILPHVRIESGPLPTRMSKLDDTMQINAWKFPLVFKPDAGQRGVSVKFIASREQAENYLRQHACATIAQVYHAGPFEAGVFYVRMPGEATGRIFSITDKKFPTVAGDGKSTLRELIWAHPRLRMQADLFLKRHAAAADDVPAKGELVRLAMAGNHCQGTLFQDGGHLITPELTRAIDAIAGTDKHFHFGRFDLRYEDIESFKAGRDFHVIELNGVTSESTNIYDPRSTLFFAYRTLAMQWKLAFEIGVANRCLGVRVSGWSGLIRDTVAHYKRRSADLTAD